MDNTDFQALGDLLAEKGLLSHIVNPPAPETRLVVSGADCDSRVVKPGHLFVCKGAAFRSSYLTSAINAGAVAYLCDEALAKQLSAIAPTTPGLVTNDVRSAMALVSAEAWGHPDHRMPIAGITGTKGKTTVAAFVRAILDGDAPGSAAAIIGTLETYDGQARFVSRNTTPEAPDLWRHLAHAAKAHLTTVMEVSSQGLKYRRVEGLAYEVAAFLNIGVDHVSPIEHPTFDDYLNSKLMLFQNAKVAVLNASLDPQHAARIQAAAQVCERVVTFGIADEAKKRPDVYATDVQATSRGMAFVAHTPAWSAPVQLALSGSFNVENALAAIAIACELECTQDRIVAGLATCQVPGRMDVCASSDGKVTAIVDYAHNGMSVSTVLSSVRTSYPDHYVVAVFGATGGKGAERRFEMPPAAAPYADHLVFTEDDAGPEPVERICAQMVEATPGGTSCEVILDRSEAIRHAITLARTSARPAVVCVLGKGHEARQLRADGPVPMVPDGEFVRQVLG